MQAQISRISTVASLLLWVTGLAAADLAKQVDEIISKPLGRKVDFSIRITKADSGKTVYDHDSRELMIPASNMKLMVSAAALRYLGPDYVYTTRVGLCGSTLVVIGSGDPLLGDERTDAKYGREPGWIFKDIINALDHKGLRTVEDIIVDTSIFDNERVHPSWPAKDLNKWYACEVSGLNYNDNCVALTARNVFGKVTVVVDPPTSFLTLINEVEPTTNGTSVLGSNRNPAANKLTVYGRCKDRAGPIDVAIERPAAFFAFLLAERLAGAGIDASGQLIERTFGEESDFVPLVEFRTKIGDCLARCNKNSLALAAEAMLKTIAAEANPDGKNGSWAGGRERISQYLTELGLDESQFYLDDGSGLSRQNELTAYAITTVLSDIYKGKNWEFYRDTLAVGGEDGTIEKYFKDERYRGKIRGKTGYISGVKSFSGVAETAGGDYMFSILANNAHNLNRSTINKIAEAIMDSELREE
ncbi:MAG: D-alanyl-D-alanine carboxypeptidase/D-alanyl-D-alanine-endopeptidase [Phycisphaerales bacterium]|nr:MAG: D-alanyl-D-alanine carboxypeptidase/D-alanyl-D-alanine-endopeptidase [Phycisphaerales bacterium]